MRECQLCVEHVYRCVEHALDAPPSPPEYYDDEEFNER